MKGTGLVVQILIRQISATLLAAALLVWAWIVVDVSWALALVVQLLGTSWAALILKSPELLMPNWWWHVQAGEARWYRRLGVGLFNKVLSAIGWNGAVNAARGFDGTRARVAALELGARRSEAAHVLLFSGSVVVVAAALAFARPGLALWSALLALPFHAYPVMLQRIVRHRAQRHGERPAG